MLAAGGLGQPNLAALGGAGGNAVISHFASQAVIFVPVIVELPNVPLLLFHFTDPDTFYPVAVAKEGVNEIFPFPVVDPDTFFTPLVRYFINISHFADPDTFRVPTIGAIAPKSIAPQKLTDADLFYVPFVDLVLKILPIPVVPQTDKVFWPPLIQAFPPDPVYDYPPLHVIDADYGFRRRTNLIKERRVIGRRGSGR